MAILVGIWIIAGYFGKTGGVSREFLTAVKVEGVVQSSEFKQEVGS